ncbi:SDR family NAD(P)-dependent oxidoreductase [Aliiruegeria sabulilitoris]|uniref:SDR family NAD(P)-dependent oxidoreductase n=1 Tax=Aliiruegeria sabulilitoris TaxID=1510458 RepID=UPI00082EC80F|nr:SDR family NAD(P)-dependent oxidoreductase [Aliiruegeria sabulilitoris]NDR59274.1 SDR family oxidoreductase [Pseudoruegeria sp. M32A2M]
MIKTAMITGGTAGIGLATAEALGNQGFRIILNGFQESRAADAMAGLKAKGIEADLFLFDVSKEEAVLSAFERIERAYPSLDVLVNNAGGLVGRSRFEDMETDFYRKVMALNLDSVFYVTRSAIPLLKAADSATIVNMTSIAGSNAGGPGAGIYGTAKAGVVTLTRAMAKDLAEYGIRVNAVSPGTIDTDFHADIKANRPEIFESWKNDILMKRVGNPEEVASVIEFLVSDKASFITGEIVQINGGQGFL